MRENVATSPSGTKEKILAAAVNLMLKQGFTATSVDEICEAAGVTKGSFFHYFDTKEELAKAALQSFSDSKMQKFESASYNTLPDPLDRLFGFVDFLISGIKNPLATPSCLIGNLTQELSQTHSEIRSVCNQSFSWHNQKIQNLIDDAVKAHPPKFKIDTTGIARYLTAVIQGSLILAKATQDNSLITENLRHFKRYLQTLFPEKLPLK